MKSSEVFPSRFLSSADIRTLGRDVIDVIERMATEELENDGRKERKRVAHLRHNKPFILNNTNWHMLAELLNSDDDDHWPGAQVQVTVEKVPFGSKLVDGLRVRAARYPNKQRPQSVPPAPPPTNEPPPASSAAEFGLGDEINDEIPF
jgi:hypothetical protein